MKDTRDVLWEARTREEFPPLAAQGAVVIVPIGSTEQHGLHLPVGVDSRTAEHAALTAARLATVPVLVTPTIWAAISPHHMEFAGTITLRLHTLNQMITDVCASIVAHGFERILIVNGHGGNRNALGAITLELRHTMGRQIRTVSWFDLTQDVLDDLREGPGADIGHAGELETSVMLSLAPDEVRTDRRKLVQGITDDPNRASAAKGEAIMHAATERLAVTIADLHAGSGREIVGIEMAPED